MMAENVNSSLTKYKYFIEGHNMIEKAIEQEKFNWESHFIRFTVQINIPVILNYNNLKEDKSFIISSIFSNYSHCNDKSYINKVILALINSGKLEEIEKLSLLKLIDKEI